MPDDTEVPSIRRRDVRALIRAVGDSVRPVSVLYDRYAAQMAAQDRAPVSRKALGTALDRCGQRLWIKRLDGKNVRCRIVRESWMAAEQLDDVEEI